MKFFSKKRKAEIKALKGYKAHFGVAANIKNPTTYCEKLIYRLKYKTDSDFFRLLADKYAVRKYVANKIGDEYLIPLLAHYESYAKLSRDLPLYKGKVVKPNHGSGMVYIVPEVLTKKSIKQAKKLFRKWIKRDYSKRHGEMQYKNIPRKFLIEEFIGSNAELPVDYKVHLFRDSNNGFNYTLETISGRGTKAIESSYFVNNLEAADIGSYQLSTHEKYKVLQAIELSKKLMGKLEYARIDWYILEDTIYFGEVTLLPAAGIDKDIDQALNIKMGAFWDMSLAE